MGEGFLGEMSGFSWFTCVAEAEFFVEARTDFFFLFDSILFVSRYGIRVLVLEVMGVWVEVVMNEALFLYTGSMSIVLVWSLACQRSVAETMALQCGLWSTVGC